MAGNEYDLPGDFPWNERARGGSRIYSSSLSSSLTRTSQPAPHADDFAALRDAALAELDQERQMRTAVLPEKEVG